MSKNLVIVESPAKAKTLSKILGRSYTLKASLGHIRDLPRSRLGVDVDNAFEPKYVVPRVKSKVVTELKKAAKEATTVYLATDPDREGEAIAWHLAEVTKSDNTPFRRVTFHEISEEAVKDAFKHPRAIDMGLVNAQQARRILDRLVGYKISPLLWRKVRRGLSAGRVQSVAVRIVVDREREITAFVPVEYWNIDAELNKKGEKPSFRASFVGPVDGAKISIHNEQEAAGLKEELEKAVYNVLKVTTKQAMRQPAPPFITSTLQQEAWRKLHFTAKQTMAVAQQLYEGLPVGDEGSVGLITYMRTDSTQVSMAAVAEAREFIGQKYGAEYVPPKPRVFTKVAKGAQEAHEAVRPTKIQREPAKIKQYLNPAQFKIYDLIWKRMVASQMAAALFDNTTVDIRAGAKKGNYLLRTSASINTFPGFIVLYTEGRDETDNEEKESKLPRLNGGDALDLLGLFPEQHFTQPPARFTEATLVKTLEQFGIGRPSTYAPILSTIQDRQYVTKLKGYFQPTELGFTVNDLLGEYFPDIVDVQFTARMEGELDEIAEDSHKWTDTVKEFYAPLEKSLEKAAALIEKVEQPVETTSEVCEKCGKPMVIKTGRFGRFMACSGYHECKNTKSLQVKIGVKCPDCGGEILERNSRKNRIFYGCANYPKCKFATSFRPIPRPCPICGGMLALHGKTVKCSKCDYSAKVEEVETKEAK